jgi:hypothetical protein
VSRPVPRELGGAAYRQGMGAMDRDPAVEGMVARLYERLRRGDLKAVRRVVSRELSVVVGPDDAEWWSGYDVVTAAVAARLEQRSGFDIRPGELRGYSHGSMGWFEDRADLTTAGHEVVAVRVTGVVRLEAGRWHLLQAHVSVGVANAGLGFGAAPTKRGSARVRW